MSCFRLDPILLNDWHVVATSSEVLLSSLRSVRLFGTDLLIWRDADGQVHAWDDRCPHRSVALSRGQVVENTVICPYHGLVFDKTGSCIRVPAAPDYHPPPQASVPTFAVREHQGLIYVCLGNPPASLPVPSEIDDPSFRCYQMGAYPIATNGLRAIENFLDVAHFSFIHDGILGDRANPEIPDYSVDLTADGLHAYDVKVWQPDPYGTGTGTYVVYDYWVIRPFTAYLRKQDKDGKQTFIVFHVSPVSETEAIGWMITAMNIALDQSDEQIQAFQDRIFFQDAALLASHRPALLPLHPSAIEFHLPSDRTSLAYRQWLKQLGIIYGVQQGTR